MASKPPYVEWYPGNFLNGVIGYDPFEIAVYTIILNMIYDNNGPIKENAPKIARRCAMRLDHFNRTVQILINDGKLIRADGVLSNPRAEKELSRRAEKIAKLMSNFSGANVVPNKNINKNNGIQSPNGPQSGVPISGGNLEPEPDLKRKKVERAAAPPQPRPNGHRPTRGSRIPADWKLSTANELYARSKGLTAKEAKFEADKFHLHYKKTTGDRALSSDWDSSWQSWVLRTVERLGREPAGQVASAGPETYSRQEWIKVVEMWERTTNWHPMHGPAPGRPGCLVPADLVNRG